MLTPPRFRGHEILDDPATDTELSVRSLHDVMLANRWFGGQRAVLHELRQLLSARAPTEREAPWQLLDVGTGLGDIPDAACRLAADLQCNLQVIGLERVRALSSAARIRCPRMITGDALALPFASGSVDIVTCSQLLHHFDGEPAWQLLRECTRVARRAVIIGDLRRSWTALAGLWASSYVLGFHPVSRHDGMVSIRRGFTRAELSSLIAGAVGLPAIVKYAPGFRVTATWQIPSSPH